MVALVAALTWDVFLCPISPSAQLIKGIIDFRVASLFDLKPPPDNLLSSFCVSLRREDPGKSVAVAAYNQGIGHH